MGRPDRCFSATKRDTSAKAVAKKPIAAVKANAIYSPDCDKKKLAGTKAATFDKRPGSTKVSFCVNAGGKVVEVKTTKKFLSPKKLTKIVKSLTKP